MITKEELISIFKEWYPEKIVISDPFFNERMPENGWKIRISIGRLFELIWFVYLKIDEDGVIKAIDEANYENFMCKLIGQQIDLNSFNDETIRGNYTDNNGIVANGQFALTC